MSVLQNPREFIETLNNKWKEKGAVMEFRYRPELVEQAGRIFDDVVTKVLAKDFTVVKIPEKKICKECDLKAYCSSDGFISHAHA